MSSPFPFLANQELDMTGHEIINVLDPLSAQSAATKNYVDTHSLSTSLANTKIFVGNASNIATAVNLSGDATLANTGAMTLATVNGNVGSFGSASAVGAFTVNAKGLVTAASSTSIQIAESQVTNLVSDLAGKQSTALTSAHILVGNGSNLATDVAVSGDLTLANTGAFTIANLAVTNAKIANATIDLSTKVTNVLPEANGGTHQSSYATGDTLYASATNTLSKLPVGTSGQVLTVAAGIPSWATPSSGSSAAGPAGAVQYSDGSGVFLADDASFHWDDTAKSLSIGTAPSPSSAILTIDGDNGNGNGQLYLSNSTSGGKFAIISVENSPPSVIGGNPGDLSVFSQGDIQLQAGSLGAVLAVRTGGGGHSVQVQTNLAGASTNQFPMLAIGDGGFAGTGAPNFTGINNNGTYIALNTIVSPVGSLMDLQSAGVSKYSITNFGRVNTSASHTDALRVATTAADDTIDAGSDYKVVYNIGAGSFNINLPPGEQGLNFILSKASTNSATLTIVPDPGNPDLLDANVQAIFTANEPVNITYDAGSLTWYAV